MQEKDALLTAATKRADIAIDRLTSQRQRFGEYRERQKKETQILETRKKKLSKEVTNTKGRIDELKHSCANAYKGKRSMVRDVVALEDKLATAEADHESELASMKLAFQQLQEKHEGELRRRAAEHAELMEALKHHAKRDLERLSLVHEKKMHGDKAIYDQQLKEKMRQLKQKDREHAYALYRSKRDATKSQVELENQISLESSTWRSEAVAAKSKEDVDAARREKRKAEVQSRTSMRRSAAVKAAQEESQKQLKQIERENNALKSEYYL